MNLENLDKMSIKEIDAELERIEMGQTNPLRKTGNLDVSDRLKKLARALMQLGYLEGDANDNTLLQVAKVLGIDTSSIESKPGKVQKSDQAAAIHAAGDRVSRKVLLQHYRNNPDELAKTSIKQINEDLGLD